MSHAAIESLRAECQRARDLFASLSEEEWQRPSGCAGWRVQDVAQHMASTFHSIADPGSITTGTSHDVEENAEVPVQDRRHWPVADVIAAYAEWSEKGVNALAGMQEAPLADMVIPLANLGSHPMHILANAIVFDHYCHLRHDIGAAVERAAALPRDPAALKATLEWMLAGVPQMCAEALSACTDGVNLSFTDVGVTASVRHVNGAWIITDDADTSLPTATTTAHDFISWGTKRADWRAMGIEVPDGAGRTLDAINVI